MLSPDNHLNKDSGAEGVNLPPLSGAAWSASPLALRCEKIAEMPPADVVENLEFILPLFDACEPTFEAEMSPSERRALIERAAKEHALILSTLAPMVAKAPQEFVKPLLARLETSRHAEKLGILELLSPLNLGVLGQDESRPVFWAIELLPTARTRYVPALLEYLKSRAVTAQPSLPALIDLFTRMEVRPADIVEAICRVGSANRGRMWQFLDDALYQDDPGIHAGALETMAVQVERCSNPEMLYIASLSWEKILNFVEAGYKGDRDESTIAALRAVRRLSRRGVPTVPVSRDVKGMCVGLAEKRLDFVGAEAIETFLQMDGDATGRVRFLKERWKTMINLCNREDISEQTASFPYYVEAVLKGCSKMLSCLDIQNICRDALRSRSVIGPIAHEVLQSVPEGVRLIDESKRRRGRGS